MFADKNYGGLELIQTTIAFVVTTESNINFSVSLSTSHITVFHLNVSLQFRLSQPFTNNTKIQRQGLRVGFVDSSL